jgi:hypothetical protein
MIRKKITEMSMEERRKFRREKYSSKKSKFIRELDDKPFKFNKKSVIKNIDRERRLSIPKEKLAEIRKDYYERKKLLDPDFIEKLKKRNKEYAKKHKYEINQKNRERYKSEPDFFLQAKKRQTEYYVKNREHILKRHRENYYKKRRC